MKGEHARESLLQRIGLAYLWEERSLLARFSYLFDTRRTDDLENLGDYFWRVRGEPLEEKTEGTDPSVLGADASRGANPLNPPLQTCCHFSVS